MSEPAPTPTTTLVEALARAQGVMKNAAFDRANPHFKSKYASLAAILDVVRKPLADNGLAVTQTIGMQEDGRLYLRTTLHGHLDTIDSIYPLPAGLKPQEFGSALTYARRYSLSAMLNISADEDDDANVAQGAGNGKAAAEPTITPEQTEALQLMLAEIVTKDTDYLPALLQWAKVESLQDILASHWDDVHDQVLRKKARLAQKARI